MFNATIIKKTSQSLLTGLALSLAFSSSALALDSKGFMQNIQDKVHGFGLAIAYDGELDVNGENVTLNNARLIQNDKSIPSSPIFPIALGTAKFQNIESHSDGSFTIGATQIAQQNQTITTDNTPPEQIVLGETTITNMHIGVKDKVYDFNQYLPYQKADISSISYNVSGKTALKLEGLSSKYQHDTGGTYKNSGGITSFTYDPSVPKGERGKNIKEILDILGYNTIQGSMSADSSWKPEQGDYSLTNYNLSANNIGSINISGQIGGLTQYFVNNYQALIFREANSQNISKKEQDKLNQDILALFFQLQLNSLTVKYDDNSLANRILDYLSQSSQATRDEIVAILKANVKRATQSLQDKDFANHVNEQLNTFLDKPQSLEITANPPQTAAFSSIAVVMGLSPDLLIKQLGIDVIANK